MHHEGSRTQSLGEQALCLMNSDDRLVALRHTTATMQVTLARAIVLQTLAAIAVRCVALLALFNPLNLSAVKWLHFRVFMAILV